MITSFSKYWTLNTLQLFLNDLHPFHTMSIGVISCLLTLLIFMMIWFPLQLRNIIQKLLFSFILLLPIGLYIYHYLTVINPLSITTIYNLCTSSWSSISITINILLTIVIFGPRVNQIFNHFSLFIIQLLTLSLTSIVLLIQTILIHPLRRLVATTAGFIKNGKYPLYYPINLTNNDISPINKLLPTFQRLFTAGLSVNEVEDIMSFLILNDNSKIPINNQMEEKGKKNTGVNDPLDIIKTYSLQTRPRNQTGTLIGSMVQPNLNNFIEEEWEKEYIEEFWSDKYFEPRAFCCPIEISSKEEDLQAIFQNNLNMGEKELRILLNNREKSRKEARRRPTTLSEEDQNKLTDWGSLKALFYERTTKSPFWIKAYSEPLPEDLKTKTYPEIQQIWKKWNEEKLLEKMKLQGISMKRCLTCLEFVKDDGTHQCIKTQITKPEFKRGVPWIKNKIVAANGPYVSQTVKKEVDLPLLESTYEEGRKQAIGGINIPPAPSIEDPSITSLPDSDIVIDVGGEDDIDAKMKTNEMLDGPPPAKAQVRVINTDLDQLQYQQLINQMGTLLKTFTILLSPPENSQNFKYQQSERNNSTYQNSVEAKDSSPITIKEKIIPEAILGENPPKNQKN